MFSLEKVSQRIFGGCGFYRPQRSCGQGNIFTRVCHSFCSQGGGGLPQCMLGYHPPKTRQTHPLEQTPPRPGRHPPEQTPPQTRQTPPRADTTPPWIRQTPPRTRQTPPEQTPPQTRQTPPWTRQTTPPKKADFSIRSTSGRYASYWNAFLLLFAH